MNALIDAADLAQAIASPRPPTVFDVRWRLTGPPGEDDYRAGHIPGAVFVDLDRDLAGSPGEAGRHPIPDTESFQAAMRAYGVSADRTVVVYDQDNGMAAARAWWMLRYLGHPYVRVLNGGFRAWHDGGHPTTTEGPVTRPGDFVARPGGMPVLDADGALLVAHTGLLLDARAPERYRGELEPVDPVAGHIPGAVNAPATGNVDGEGRFLPREELRERFAALGAGSARVGAYCGSGVTAAHEVLALWLAGVSAELYVGSWSHWVADPARPVAREQDHPGSSSPSG